MTVGIDFSINHCGICIKKDNGDCKFILLVNSPKHPTELFDLKEYSILSDAPIEIITYNRDIDKTNYITEQQTKLVDAIALAKLVCSLIPDRALTIAIEGFSYGSQSNSFLDLVLYASLLRKALYEKFGEIIVLPPSEIKKKFTGKGNADKKLMIETFLSEQKDFNFYKYLKRQNIDYKHLGHIDDLVDAYSICSIL